MAVKGPLATVSTVRSFIAEIGKIKRGAGLTTFRGQRNATWAVEPGILRAPQKLLAHEKQAVRDLLSIHPQEFHADSMFDRLVRMQHYGLPTRLLDVTGNPLVALYFATEPYRSRLSTVDGKVYVFSVPDHRTKYFDSDAVSCVANLSNLSSDEKQTIIDSKSLSIEDFNETPSVDRLLQFVRVEKPHFRNEIVRLDLFRPFYVIPKMSNRRIIAQSGAFIIYGLPPTKTMVFRRDINVNSIIVPQDAKSLIRSELESLGINESTLFPEIDRAASYIARRYST
jgi:hypothetical protein